MTEQRIKLQVEGMTCMGCVSTVQRYLESNGAEGIRVDLSSGEVNFKWVKDEVALNGIKKGIGSLGYQIRSEEHQKSPGIELKTLVAILFTLPLLLFHVLAMIPGINVAWVENGWLQFAICLPVFGIGAWHFGKSAFKALRQGIIHMDVLIFIGSTAAFIYSLVGTLTASPELLFYETSAMIITLVLIGNYLERRALKQTRSAIDALVSLKPDVANRVGPDDTIEKVSTIMLAPFDIVIVNMGDAIPADGIVIDGNGYVDESMISGESQPVYKSGNDEVIGATSVKEGNFRVQVTRTGSNSVLQRIIELVKTAQSEKPGIQRLADKISAVFVPVVISIALLTFVISHFVFEISMTQALLNSVAVLVISCPCAMGLATPTAISVGVGRISRQGILIKHAQVLETLPEIQTLVFDKTGTLTTGEFDIEMHHISGDRDQNISILYQLESQSSHPIAKSIMHKLSQMKIPENGLLQRVAEISGKGVEGHDRNGRRYFVGTGQDEDPENQKELSLTMEGKELIRIVVADQLRPHAVELITNLKNQNVQPVILSGDGVKQVEDIATHLSINDFYSGVSPQKKLEILATLRKDKRIGMVGDGINDAAVLAKADVGISLSAASQIAINAADIVILNNDLSMIDRAFRVSKATVRTIKQNLFWAFSYNIIAIPLAALGFLNPMWGALFMTLSDIIVIGNSIRLKYRKIP